MLLVPDFSLKTVVVFVEKGPYVGWIALKAEGEEEECQGGDHATGYLLCGGDWGTSGCCPCGHTSCPGTSLVPWDTAHIRSVSPCLDAPEAPWMKYCWGSSLCFCGEEEQLWPAWHEGAVTQNWHMVWPQ